MRYIRDKTGRFHRRPFFPEKELNVECETIITEFLQEINGEVEFPVSTDDLTKLIEQDAADLDLYADLTDEGQSVEGVTEFYPGETKPHVRISRQLSEPAWAENRLRTTLTHEYGHVRFHASVWELDADNSDLFDDQEPADKAQCNRDTMIDAPAADWMEWQAGFISGALLMPRGPVNELVADVCQTREVWGQIHVESEMGQYLIGAVTETFQVSTAAARVRLLQLGALTEEDPGLSLFD